jgi:hypothetical protein
MQGFKVSRLQVPGFKVSGFQGFKDRADDERSQAAWASETLKL